MTTRSTLIIAALIAALVGLVRAGVALAEPPASAPQGSAFTYQGRLVDGAAPASGSYDFTFRLYDAADGGAQIGAAVSLDDVAVAAGLFAVRLDFGPGAFAGGARWLEITVGGVTLAPRQPLTAAPIALSATTAQTATHALSAASVPWSGLGGVPAGLDDGDDDTTYAAGKGLALNGTSFEAKGSPLSNTVVVAGSGGDFGSVQAAIDSVAGAGPANPYTVFVASGVYTEQVTLKPHVHLRGAGQGATVIRWGGGEAHPQGDGGSATVRTANNSSLADLTIESSGNGVNVAIYNRDAAVSIRDVTVNAAASSGGQAYAIYNYNAAAQIAQSTVNITAGYFAYGVYNYGGSNASVADSSIKVSATVASIGTYTVGSTLRVRNSTISGSTSIDRGANATMQIAYSQLIGQLANGAACVGNYNINLVPIICP
ncbi:MAG TPA: hypothetical protein VD886_11015 [Herpetosiphonaceae bacterium]|nr:hypothetical protein [Herpetosiphonaceae bacterium]